MTNTSVPFDVRVYLGGEGPNEMGSRARDPVYQTDSEPGVVQALLKGTRRSGWVIGGAIRWSKIRKFRATGPSPAEERNVLGLVLAAKDAACEIVAFVRDADDQHARQSQIAEAITKAQTEFPSVKIIGGTAFPVLEGWILAIRNVHGTESMSKTKAQSELAKAGVNGTLAMVTEVEASTLKALPKDATSLRV